MGYHKVPEGTQKFNDLPEKYREGVKKLLSNIDISVYHNPELVGIEENRRAAVVQVEVPDDETIDVAANRRPYQTAGSPEVLHMNTMFYEGTIREVSMDGTVVISVCTRY